MQEASSINSHFLRQLVTLASIEDVSTAEDVYSSTGIKLIAKGAHIDADLYERIISHKLRKPLESSICVSEPVTPQLLANTATILLDASPSLRKFLGNDGSDVLVTSLVKRARYSLQAGSLLKLHQSKVAKSVHHGILVGLLAMGMQRRLSPGDAAELDTLIVASIFHDIGELYLAPELFRAADIPLTPEEWRQITAHPVIGHAVLRNMGGIAPGVADLVLLHHERLDGSGYPQHLAGNSLSKESQILAAAEMMARFIGESANPFAHANIAFKIIPGEFDSRLVDIVAGCHAELQQAQLLQSELNGLRAGTKPIVTDGTLQLEVGGLMKALVAATAALAECEAVCALATATASSKQCLSRAAHRFEQIVCAVSNSGLDQAVAGLRCEDAAPEEVAGIRLECVAVQDEIRWRLQELSRQISVQSTAFNGAEVEAFLNFAQTLEPAFTA